MRDLQKRRKVFLFWYCRSGSVVIGSASFSNDNLKTNNDNDDHNALAVRPPLNPLRSD